MKFHIYLDEGAQNDSIRKAKQDLDEMSSEELGRPMTKIERVYFHRDEYGLCIESYDYLEELPPQYKQFARHVKQIRFYDEFPGGEIPVGIYEASYGTPDTKSRAVVEERLTSGRVGDTIILTRIRITAPSVESTAQFYRAIRRGDLEPTEKWRGAKVEA